VQALVGKLGPDFIAIDLYRRRLLKCTRCGSRKATIRMLGK
jgi:hypothetical protein